MVANIVWIQQEWKRYLEEKGLGIGQGVSNSDQIVMDFGAYVISRLEIEGQVELEISGVKPIIHLCSECKKEVLT